MIQPITQKRAHELIAMVGQIETPMILMDSQVLDENIHRYQSVFPGMKIYFPVKANNHPLVLRKMHSFGLGFEVASRKELDLLFNARCQSASLLFSAPIKRSAEIAYALREGVSLFTFDSEDELRKIARIKEKISVQVRITVGNEGSAWPQERKFGVDLDLAEHLMINASAFNLDPAGITFHVGSQNRNPQAWAEAVKTASILADRLAKKGIQIRILDIGGGFPAYYGEDVPELEAYGKVIKDALNAYFPPAVSVILEPGRGLVGPAGVLVTEVVGTASRGEERWVYVDAGVFNGLIEARDNFRYPIVAEAQRGELIPWIVAGASCDSADVIQEGVLLPRGLTEKDRLLIFSTGAYVNSLENYNGMRFPDLMMAE